MKKRHKKEKDSHVATTLPIETQQPAVSGSGSGDQPQAAVVEEHVHADSHEGDFDMCSPKKMSLNVRFLFHCRIFS